ncbi:MAG: OmpA family protein [Kofleriaceae bacterium]|nr:OmpA family protein [Kofleriaceae bacterium]MCL4227713.1 OmpA family protein [Myxococcales bacterium]
MTRPARLPWVLSALTATLVLAPSLARAQGGDVNINPFHHAMDSRGYLTLNASQPLGHKEFSFGLVTDWGYKLLEFEQGANFTSIDNVITPTLIAAAGFKLGPAELELGVGVPFVIVAGDRDPDSDGGTPGNPNDDQRFKIDGQGLGNVALHLKTRFLKTTRGPKVGLGLVASVYLPTASEKQKFLGEDGLTPQVMAILEKEFGRDRRLRLGLNAGVRIRTGATEFTDDASSFPTGNPPTPETPFTNRTFTTGTELPVGVGLAYAITPQKFDVVGEVYGAVPLGGENYFPLEAIGGIKVYLARNSFLTIGGGTGLMPGKVGSAKARAFIGIVFEPNIGDRDGDGIKDDVDDCPDDPEDYDDFEDEDGCPEPDNDKDGILDEDDKCPLNPEDKDGFEDEDGCPEGNVNDRDGDGILDDVDQCPDDPEDFDKFQDEDGCPDPDNDQDGILDVDDLCPNDPEDKDGWEDEDGCPDPDNDGDKILDVDDRCPNEPETKNGFEDEDGCPDRGRVVVTDTKIEILDKVYFEYNKAIIKSESYPILDAVAATLEGNPDIQLVEVQGHTDERGNDAYNLDLSDKRAKAVVKYLVDKGIEQRRLQGQGYGETQPIDRKSNEAAWAKNRRVEFLILKRSNDD